MGAVTGHAESPLVLVILHLDHDEGRVRSHFQRLVLSEDLQQAEEQQRREAAELRLQKRELAAMAAADLEAEAWRAYVREAAAASELLAMGAADAEGEACREWARQAADAAAEEAVRAAAVLWWMVALLSSMQGFGNCETKINTEVIVIE